MKKLITVVLEVDTDDANETIIDDLEREIACASNAYELTSIKIEEQK